MKGRNATGKFFLIIFIATIVAGCHPKQHPISKAQMKEDVSYFFKCFLSTHPNPYCRATPKQVDSIRSSLIKKIENGLNIEEFQNELNKLNGILDGHSAIKTSSLAIKGSDTSLLPPIIRVNSNLTLSINRTVLSASNTVTCINGYSANKLVSMMNQHFSIDSGIVNRINIERYFPILLTRLGIKSPYVIKVRLAHCDTTLLFNGYKYGSNEHEKYFLQIRNIPLNGKKEEVDCSIFPKSSIAVLYFNTCNPKSYESFKSKIDSIFIEIKRKKISHLFIDISRNEGGSDYWGSYLIDKINHKAYSFSFYSRINVTPSTYKALMNLITNFLKSGTGQHPSKKILETINKYRSLKVGTVYIDSGTTKISAVTKGYNGNIYILVSNRTRSAGSGALWEFIFAKKGKVLGEKSGSGNPMYVYPAEFTLPYSKVKFEISVRQSGYVNIQGKKMAFLNVPEPDVPFNINLFKTSYSEQELLDLVRLANRK